MNHVRSHMTESPHTIGQEQRLSLAAERMRELSIRHLPVLHGGQLVGVLSDRDVALVDALPGVELEAVSVEEAMSAEPYAVAPNASVSEVAATMAEHKYGCAVVMEGNAVVGIFTTVDGMALLARLLEAQQNQAA